jgi:hypothetical protein
MLETWKIFRETSSIKKTTLETRVILSLRIIRVATKVKSCRILLASAGQFEFVRTQK